MRFNWDAVIPAVALMHDDPAVKPITGTGFSVERDNRGNPNEYVIRLQLLDQPTESAEPKPPAAA